jgi:hypothetical protein
MVFSQYFQEHFPNFLEGHQKGKKYIFDIWKRHKGKITLGAVIYTLWTIAQIYGAGTLYHRQEVILEEQREEINYLESQLEIHQGSDARTCQDSLEDQM